MRHRLLIALCLLARLFLPSPHVSAQDEKVRPSTQALERISVSQAGIQVYRPDTWGMIATSIRNPQDQDIEVLMTSYMAENPTLQYGQRLWLPARARRASWHPIRMPSVTSEDQKFFEIRTLLSDPTGNSSSLASNDIGGLLFDQSIHVSPKDLVTVFIGPRGMEETYTGLMANSMDLLRSARYERGLSRNLFISGSMAAPPGEELLEVVDHLVIASDRIIEDSAATTAVRRWVARGGSMWVMADQVSPHVLETLLGDEAGFAVIDRVDLSHVHVVASETAPSTPPFERDLDAPAPLVRMTGDRIESMYVVDDWPAAFWMNYGNGRILVTTLGADGWIRPRQQGDHPPPTGAHFQTRFVISDPLSTLASEFFRPRPAPRFEHPVAEEQVRQMVGYSIPSRPFVLGTLLLFTILFGLSAFFLARRGHLEWLGLAVPVFAALASVILLTAGFRARSEISDTAATMQYVQSVPGTDDVIVSGVNGVFTKGEGSSTELWSTSGGWAMPEMGGIEGTTRQLIWNDIDSWSWEKLPSKPGLRTVLTQSSGQVQSSHRPNAVAGFSNGQLRGQSGIPAEMAPTDAILVTRRGRLGLQINNSGEWTLSDDNDLGSDQYLAAGVLTDEQQRRSHLLADLLKFDPIRPNPPDPTLLVWTKPWQLTAFETPQAPPALNGSALVAMPLVWQRPSPGSEFTLPNALLEYREITGPDGSRPSGLFDTRANQWVERTRGTSGWIAFDTPEGLLPLETRKVVVRMKVRGAMKRLELLCGNAVKVQSIQVWDDPVGTLTCTIEDPHLIPIDQSGRLMFRLDVGIPDQSLYTPPTGNSDAAQPSLLKGNDTGKDPAVYWRFEEISARVTVAVPEAPNTATASASTQN